MATRPTNDKKWSESAPENRNEPGNERSSGFQENEFVPNSQFNWLLWDLYNWVDYFDDKFQNATGKVSFESEIDFSSSVALTVDSNPSGPEDYEWSFAHTDGTKMFDFESQKLEATEAFDLSQISNWENIEVPAIHSTESVTNQSDSVLKIVDSTGSVAQDSALQTGRVYTHTDGGIVQFLDPDGTSGTIKVETIRTFGSQLQIRDQTGNDTVEMHVSSIDCGTIHDDADDEIWLQDPAGTWQDLRLNRAIVEQISGPGTDNTVELTDGTNFQDLKMGSNIFADGDLNLESSTGTVRARDDVSDPGVLVTGSVQLNETNPNNLPGDDSLEITNNTKFINNIQVDYDNSNDSWFITSDGSYNSGNVSINQSGVSGEPDNSFKAIYTSSNNSLEAFNVSIENGGFNDPKMISNYNYIPGDNSLYIRVFWWDDANTTFKNIIYNDPAEDLNFKITAVGY